MSKVIKDSLLSLMIFTVFSLQTSVQINEEIDRSFSVVSHSDVSLNKING
ncbi:MAG: hypothetical protein ACI8SC_003113 [Colwellia sp.]|jgi:hypothetical protein